MRTPMTTVNLMSCWVTARESTVKKSKASKLHPLKKVTIAGPGSIRRNSCKVPRRAKQGLALGPSKGTY